MCKKKRNKKIDQQLETNRAEAEAAKDTAQKELQDEKQAALDIANEESNTVNQVTEDQLDRQSENISTQGVKEQSLAALRRSRRSGGRGRRSLFTAKTGAGYYSRFGL